MSTPINRRELLAGLGGFALTAALRPADAHAFGPSDAFAVGPSDAHAHSAGTPTHGDAPGAAFPRKADFAIPDDVTFLNGAFTHPLPIAAADAMRDHVTSRSRPGVAMTTSGDLVRTVKAEFAALINAQPAEISFIPNTSTGENLVVNGLRIPERAGTGINVVTDALHFEGALVHLQALQRTRGLDLRVAMPRDFRIELADLERLIDSNTVLVELSSVAMYNGFEHDLKAVCDLAHAHGALVYADIIQGAGAVPLDVRATGVDFCACAGFKWLMSDFGLGFLYAREELLGTAIERSTWGYHSTRGMRTHFLPYDEGPGPDFTDFISWEAGTDASAFFEVGSNANGALAALGASLPYIRRLGVENIRQHRIPLLRRLHAELPRLGFTPATPPETTSPLVTFTMPDGRAVAERLRAARINTRVAANFIRISPSVYNDMADIDRLLDALS